MSVEFPKEPVRGLFATLAALAPSRVFWSGEAEKTLGPIGGKAGKIVLNVTAIAELGTVEPRRTYSAGPPETQTTVWGRIELVTISITADNFLRRGEAYDTLREVRMRLALPSSKRVLKPAGLAYIDSPLIVSRDYVVDTRDVSRATLDVRFSQVVTVSPESDANEGWIAKVSSTNPPDPAAAPAVDLEFTPNT